MKAPLRNLTDIPKPSASSLSFGPAQRTSRPHSVTLHKVSHPSAPNLLLALTSLHRTRAHRATPENMVDSNSNEAEPAKPRSPARPLIGAGISLCLLVVSIMTGYLTICGPDQGYNRAGPPTLSFQLSMVLLFASLAGFAACIIWFVIVLVTNAFRS
jgi:hypothetical protein